MYAIVKSGEIEQSGALKILFPLTSFPGDIPPDSFKNENGLQQVVEGAQSDTNYYNVEIGPIALIDGQATQTYTNTAKDLGTLKVEKVAFVKDQASQRLSMTDWMVIRSVERGVPIPSETTTYRLAVVAECTRLETAINASADVDALIAVMNAQNWPDE